MEKKAKVIRLDDYRKRIRTTKKKELDFFGEDEMTIIRERKRKMKWLKRTLWGAVVVGLSAVSLSFYFEGKKMPTTYAPPAVCGRVAMETVFSLHNKKKRLGSNLELVFNGVNREVVTLTLVHVGSDKPLKQISIRKGGANTVQLSKDSGFKLNISAQHLNEANQWASVKVSVSCD